MELNHQKIESKWQKYWEENETFKTDIYDFSKPKYYVLDMFPYPSGVGLHAGHCEGYTATDIVSRMKRMQGYNVLHPMGYDSFGLPAEQYAVQTGNHPDGFTQKNVAYFTEQLKSLGYDYDWTKTLQTSDPKFYKWTQWIFKQLFKDGYAKYVDMPVNWCEELGTVLSNDEVIDGKSERGGYPVVRKNMRQLCIDQVAFAEALLSGLDELDWPESTKEIQRNWIGKSIGAHVDFKVKGFDEKFTVFTTRCDTLYGATYCVLAPEHKLVEKITTLEQQKEVRAYQKACASKSDLERTELNKEKTGVFTGAYAINPVNNKEIPIYISDYVLASYGTGAIMAVPAHDTRDYEFAKKFNIPIIQVLEEETGTKVAGETKKKSIVAILYDENQDKYLTLNWHDLGGYLFIGGTVKDDEDPLTCAKREIAEETGYTDIRLIRELPKINHHYYAKNKDIYFNTEATGYFFALNSSKKESLKLDADEVFDITWQTKEEILKNVTDQLHAKTFLYALKDTAMTEDGIHINSEILNGLNKEEAITKMLKHLEEIKAGSKQVNYKFREWIFARQRYWGEPVPIVHMEDNTDIVLEDEQLPLILPKLNDYKGKNGQSPLENAIEWKNYVSKDGKKGKRETSTMPGSAGSSWYYLRYIDPQNDNIFCDPKLAKHWMPVDLYMGGPEHAVGHLIYSRIWNHYLYDKGYSPVKEPFKKLVHQGMILGENGIKMGKRYPEYAIDPKDIAKKYGADTLRLYLMFMGPIEASKPWSAKGVEGAYKFVQRVFRFFTDASKIVANNDGSLDKIYHATVKKVTNDFEALAFNTAISQLMIFVNECYKVGYCYKEYALGFIKMISCITPHAGEEMWEIMGQKDTIAYASWPKYDESKIIDKDVNIAVSINGKLRTTFKVPIDTSKEELEKLALANEKIQKYTQDKTIVKIIVVVNKIVNIVLK